MNNKSKNLSTKTDLKSTRSPIATKTKTAIRMMTTSIPNTRSQRSSTRSTRTTSVISNDKNDNNTTNNRIRDSKTKDQPRSTTTVNEQTTIPIQPTRPKINKVLNAIDESVSINRHTQQLRRSSRINSLANQKDDNPIEQCEETSVVSPPLLLIDNNVDLSLDKKITGETSSPRMTSTSTT
ncbi:hypothetical protein BLA29_010914 [Euroglyphus maynei]|uniref:Uncharacterized protein n=1 Tax=Euroglyphus maynei TaxID=6958 RepID=A0A1Y3B212_EURMA|nr:hypothetical protein BLA29_010914 [Euroglyphus maynei]